LAATGWHHRDACATGHSQRLELRRRAAVTAALCARTACERNWPSVPWVINETPDLQCMIDFGVTGIKTDYPTRLLQMVTTTK
jgi:hypothetical protein